METKFIEAAHSINGDGPLSGGNWGKFCVARFEPEEAVRPSAYAEPAGYPLLAHCGWGMAEVVTGERVWVLDLQTGEGAFFRAGPGGFPAADLEKHKIWVCPMFQPWLRDLVDLGLPYVIIWPHYTAPHQAVAVFLLPRLGREDWKAMKPHEAWMLLATLVGAAASVVSMFIAYQQLQLARQA